MGELIASFKAYGIYGILLFALLFCIKNPDKIQMWISLVQRCLGNKSLKYERKSISNEIEARINLFAKKVNREAGEIFLYGVKIQWVEDSLEDLDRAAFVKENQVILKMKPHQNQGRNMAIATINYVSKSLIPKGRVYVSNNIMKSIDLKMVHKILLSNKLSSALDYFNDHIFLPEIKNEPRIKEFFEKMHNLDDHGFFTSVLLFELMILGKEIPPGIQSIRKRAIAEVGNFISFLNDLAIRKPGEEPGLDFIRKEIKVSLLLIARREKLGIEEIYLKRFKKDLEIGSERVYVGSAGPDNIKFAKTVCFSIENKYEVDKILEEDLDVMNRRGDRTKGYICLFQTKSENAQ